MLFELLELQIKKIIMLSTILLSFSAWSVPVVQAPFVAAHATDQLTLEWPKLSEEDFKTEIRYHKKRVLFLSSLISSFLKFNEREIIVGLAQVHDDAKLNPVIFKKLYELYQLKVSADHPTIQNTNQMDAQIQFEKLIELKVFDGQEITMTGLRALMIVDLADKFDRYMYPRTLARKTFNIRSRFVVSPEFNKVLSSLHEYVDLKNYLSDYLYTDVSKVEELIRFVEKNYPKWMKDKNLIPDEIYMTKACWRLF